MTNQHKTRAIKLQPNVNKTFSIGIPIVVENYYHNLGFEDIFGPLKSKGVDVNSLVKLLVTYKLVENHSITKAADWANQAFVRERYGLSRLDQQTLYRTLERLGTHTDEIMAHIQHALFEVYDFPSTDVNLDWTSIVLHGNMAKLGKYGYSRDHRPDKQQITLGLCELASPVNVPIGMTVRAGNINDQDHFKDTYSQVRHLLKDESLVIFDKGASSQCNKELVRYDHPYALSQLKEVQQVR